MLTNSLRISPFIVAKREHSLTINLTLLERVGPFVKITARFALGSSKISKIKAQPGSDLKPWMLSYFSHMPLWQQLWKRSKGKKLAAKAWAYGVSSSLVLYDTTVDVQFSRRNICLMHG